MQEVKYSDADALEPHVLQKLIQSLGDDMFRGFQDIGETVGRDDW